MPNNANAMLYKFVTVAAIGGLLFGYDTAVISGAIGYMEEKFSLTPAMKGWVASCALIGCLIGSTFAGWLSDTVGRKIGLLLSAAAFAVSSIGIIPDLDLNYFVFFRLIGGLGIGIASIVVPLYISEIAPAKNRGRLITIYQLGIVTGILIIYIVNYLIATTHDHSWNVEIGWRWMFGSGLIPSILFMILLAGIPETPRWLTLRGRTKEAHDISKLLPDSDTAAGEESTTGGNAGLAQLFKPGLRRALFIGIALAVFSQISGINVIMYYAPMIFKSAGSGEVGSLFQTLSVGAINFMMTWVAIKYVDLWGRKFLLMLGASGMAVSLFMVGLLFYFDYTGIMLLFFILSYISFFAISLGPLTFVVIAEIFPTSIRGRASGIAIFFLWLSVYIVSQTFPLLLETLGPPGTFWIYMGFSIAAAIFIWKYIPETKGKTLEQIEDLWKPTQS